MPSVTPRIIRNITGFSGILLIVGGTAMFSTASAVIITGVLLAAVAVTGMLLTWRK